MQMTYDVERQATHRVGRLGVAISGEDPVLPDVAAELRPLEVTTADSPARLAFRFGSRLAVNGGFRVGDVTATRTAVESCRNRLRSTVSAEDSMTVVHVRSEMTTWKHRFIPPWLAKVRDRAYLSPTENTAKSFLYGLFDFTTQLSGLPLGQSWLHAGAVADDRRCVGLLGAGGVGKTSTMLQLTLRDGFRYLSDDLALLTDDGVIHRSPKRMQVYGYNLVGDSELRDRLLHGRSPIDRMAWAIRHRMLGPSAVRRRVSAESLLDDQRVADSARLTHAFFLRSADVPRVRVEEATASWVAERSAWILLDELSPLGELAVAANSSAASAVLPTPSDFVERTRAVLEVALRSAVCRVVDVPFGSRPDELRAAVLGALDE